MRIRGMTTSEGDLVVCHLLTMQEQMTIGRAYAPPDSTAERRPLCARPLASRARFRDVRGGPRLPGGGARGNVLFVLVLEERHPDGNQRFELLKAEKRKRSRAGTDVLAAT